MAVLELNLRISNAAALQIVGTASRKEYLAACARL